MLQILSSMASRGKALLFVVIILHLIGIFSFAIIGDTLFQGQNLTRWEKSTSTSEVHELFFRSISYDISKIRRYLVLSASGRVPHWIGNPLEAHESVGKLTIDDYGNFKILYDRGVSDSLIIYSSEATEKINASATLLNNGNLVLREMNSDGSVKRVLWQSFDHPLYVLLPEMRLGFNKATGEIWNLTSWIGPNTPVLGSFTLGMDPDNTKRLVIWWRRKVYWTSGTLNDGSFSSLKTTFGRYNFFFFSYFSDENETYVNYSTNSAEAPFIMLNSLGRLIGQASVSCNGHDNPALVGGCLPLRPPHCRNPETNVSMEDFKYGNISQEGQSQETDNLSLYDCGVMCLNNCSCVAYAAATSTKEETIGCDYDRRSSNDTRYSILHMPCIVEKTQN